MRFTLDGRPLDMDPGHLIIAGWTGRDEAAIAHHIEELAAIGVKPPSETPLYYRVSSALLTTEQRVEVVGRETSGEAEPMLIRNDGRWFLGLGSDHTDRALEAHSVALSKQICAKPCAPELWSWEDVADRLDTLKLESWILEDGEWILYQQGALTAIRPLADLIHGSGIETLDGGRAAAMMCGTLGAIGGVRPAAQFRMRLTDPEMDRAITHEYRTDILPEIL